jgi:hypothetical protein
MTLPERPATGNFLAELRGCAARIGADFSKNRVDARRASDTPAIDRLKE